MPSINRSGAAVCGDAASGRGGRCVSKRDPIRERRSKGALNLVLIHYNFTTVGYQNQAIDVKNEMTCDDWILHI